MMEGPGAYRAGYPYAWAPSDVEKILLIFTVKKMLKFENFWKCAPENVPFQISEYATGWEGNTDVCPGQ